MMEINIREAKREDCKRLMELVKELAEYERAPDEVTVSAEHFEESGFGNNPVWWALVAEADKQVVGFALYYVRFSTWKGSRMYLEDILVTKNMRGKGIGRKLFDSIIVEARKKKFSGIVWQVLDWNEPAINFYKKYGAKISGEWLTASLEI
jgi:GNAT superfamily N-acetyltransferase